MKKALLLFFLPFFVSAFTFSNDFYFSKDLKIGDTDHEVQWLQEFLNNDPGTLVADQGFGSVGNETDYFGSKTEDAVKRFQEKYRDDILVPAGLALPTGYFGPGSRSKANDLLDLIRSDEQTSDNDNGFEIDDEHVVFTEESFAQSKLDNTRPTINKVTPTHPTSARTKIVITGTYFTPTNNVVYGSIGEIRNIASSDGKTIEITLSEFSAYKEARQYYSGETEIYFGIVNDYGLSTELGLIRFNFPIQSHQNQIIATSSASSSQNTSAPENNSENSNVSSTKKKAENTEEDKGFIPDIGAMNKSLFAITPKGTLIKLIGGEELFDSIYPYTPGGMLFGGGAGGSGGGGIFGGGGGTGSGGSGSSGGSSTGGGSSGGGIQNFGGRVTNITYCTCSVSILLDIQDVRGGTKSLLYTPGATTLYNYYNIYSSGQNVAGLYTSGGGTCQVYSGNSCQSQGNPQGTMTKVGTSAY